MCRDAGPGLKHRVEHDVVLLGVPLNSEADARWVWIQDP